MWVHACLDKGAGTHVGKENPFLAPPSPPLAERSSGPFSTPPPPPPAWGAQAQCLPGGAGGEQVSHSLVVCPCGHQLLCGPVEERGVCTVRWSSRSDDLSSRPAQLLSRALAPPKRGRGPGRTGSRRQRLQPEHLSSQTPGLRPRARTSVAQPDTGGFVHSFPSGARWDHRSPASKPSL